MASTYSNLKIELIGTGDQSGTWGSTTNVNLGTALEEAIVGRATANFTTDANLTITLSNVNTTQVARNYILNVTSGVALTATRSLIVPTINKPYIIENNTTGGQSILVKTSAGTGITVPTGKTVMVYANGTNVVQAFDYVPSVTVGTVNITSLAAGSITDTGLTSGRITYASTGGLLTDSASLTYDGTTLTSTKFAGAFNGTLGATTPSTVVATTGSFTGPTPTGSAFVVRTTGGDAVTITTRATGLGGVISATDTTLTTYANLDIICDGAFIKANNGATVLTISRTALAVTGNLSATGTLTGITDLTTTGNTILGDGATDTVTTSGNIILAKATGTATLSPVEVRISSTNSASDWDFTNPWGKLGFYSNDAGGVGYAHSFEVVRENAAGTDSILYCRRRGGSNSWSVDANGNFFTYGNTTLGDASTDTLNVGNGDLIKDASGNVGIGVTPSARLSISKVGSSGATNISISNDTDASGAVIQYIGSTFATTARQEALEFYMTGANTKQIFYTNATERMRIDSSGNVGIGVTPSAWSSSRIALQLGTTGSIFGATNEQVNVGSNFYISTAGFSTYITSNYASRYLQQTGTHYWYTAPSGTAGNPITFTQAMTLDASGNLGIGTSSYLLGVGSTHEIAINGTNGAVLSFGYGGVLSGYLFQSGNNLNIVNQTASGYLSFKTNATERMQIDSSGNVGIGVTPSATGSGYKSLEIGSIGNGLTSRSSATFDINQGVYWAAGSAPIYSQTGVATGHYRISAGVHTWDTAPSGTAGNPITFTQAMKLDASGILLVGATSATGTNKLQVSTDATINGLTVGKGGGGVSTNTAVGIDALLANSSGIRGSVFGYNAGAANTSGADTVAFGSNALRHNTTGNQNSAFGTNALATNISGSSNTAIGSFALESSTGNYNTAVGRDALLSNTTASNNTAVGYQAGYSTVGGNGYNTFIGYWAGKTVNSSTGYGNTFVGSYAGRNVTTGNSNNFFGGLDASGNYAAGSAITTGSKNTIVGSYSGNNGGLDIRTASNYIVLSDGDGNPLVSTNSTSSVALNGATPKTGTGITFPATQSASTDANTLDDYEEGTFTPTGLDQSSHAFPSYTTQVGFYTKVGNLVTFRLRMRTGGSTVGMTTTQQLQIGGLPFVIIDTTGASVFTTTVGLVALAPSTYLNVCATTATSGGTALNINAIGGDVTSPYNEKSFTVANFESGDGAYINISGTYFTN